MRNELIHDMAEMEEAMSRLAESRDTWQGAVLYAMAKAVWHLLQIQIRREKKQ